MRTSPGGKDPVILEAGPPMGVSISVLAHLVMKCMIQFIARLSLT